MQVLVIVFPPEEFNVVMLLVTFYYGDVCRTHSRRVRTACKFSGGERTGYMVNGGQKDSLHGLERRKNSPNSQ